MDSTIIKKESEKLNNDSLKKTEGSNSPNSSIAKKKSFVLSKIITDSAAMLSRESDEEFEEDDTEYSHGKYLKKPEQIDYNKYVRNTQSLEKNKS